VNPDPDPIIEQPFYITVQVKETSKTTMAKQLKNTSGEVVGATSPTEGCSSSDNARRGDDVVDSGVVDIPFQCAVSKTAD